MAASLPERLELLVLTGGEPFLRSDFVDVVRIFQEENRPFWTNISTNGLLPDRIVDAVSKMLPTLQGELSVQVSVDGLRETHDRIRGASGSFDKAVTTIRRLKGLAEDCPALRVVALTVICDQNYEEIEEVAGLLHDELGIDHGFELVRDNKVGLWGVRPEVREASSPRALSLPPMDRLDEIHQRFRRINAREGYPHALFVTKTAYQIRMLKKKKKIFDCVAGGNLIGVVYADGSVAHCEFTRPFANLADFDFDFPRLWASPEAESRRKDIAHCYCVHTCYLTKNMQSSLRANLGLITGL